MKKFALSTVAVAVMVAMSGAAVAADKTGQFVFDEGTKDIAENVTLSTSSQEATVIVRKGANITYSGSSINIVQNGSAGDSRQLFGARIEGDNKNSTLNLGANGKTQDVNIKVVQNGTGGVTGLVARGDTAVVNVNAKTLNVDVRSESSWAYGVLAQNATTNQTKGDFQKLLACRTGVSVNF